MKYIVSVRVAGTIDVITKADTPDEAKWAALNKMANEVDCYGFNGLDYIDIEALGAEDENGKLYEF